MSRIAYETWSPRGASLAIIRIANDICADYQQQGYDLTLRQLYYQFVSRDHLPNNQQSYKMLGTVIDKARKAGLMDWGYIVDRTRNLAGNRTYDAPSDLIQEMIEQFYVDMWENQDTRIEVWVEKEALAGVVQRAALARGCNYFSCRGYVSQSEMHSAALRHRYYERQGQNVVVLHLGDHDPSGIDMTRDIRDRLSLFRAHTTVERIALNMDQVEQYSPPPNPAKLTDSRSDAYIDEFGDSSWELDALDPATLNELIISEIDRYADQELYDMRAAVQERGRDQLSSVSESWDQVVETFC